MRPFPFARLPKPAAPVAAAFLCAALPAILLAACAADPSNTTRFSVEDFEEMGAKMAKSLQTCPAIQKRVASDAPWLVSVQKVTNLSSDILTPGEQWYAVKRVQASAPIQKMWESHRIQFVLNAEEAALQTGAQPEEFDANYAKDRRVTHVITATYRSATRNQSDVRSDLYVCIFEMKELATGISVWSDEFTIKRQAFGSLRD